MGIDPIPLKTCNWNCVYCQLGRSRPLINDRKAYIDPNLILLQVKQALSRHAPGEIDWVTFVGSGEPTLHADLGMMIRAVKGMTEIPVAVITNGAFLYLPEVQRELLDADVVDAILEIIARHPMSQTELEQILQDWPEEEISHVLEKLQDSGQAQIIERFGVDFWSAGDSYYSSDR